MKVKEAKTITGGLSSPGKMPGKSYNLPSLKTCPTGSKLAKCKGTICSQCYGLKNRYRFSNVKQAQENRKQATKGNYWVEAMITLIERLDCPYFRWHDTGDVYSFDYLQKIMSIAKRLPKYYFWLPTLETDLIQEWLDTGKDIPKNLNVRISSHYPYQADELPDDLDNVPGVTKSGVECDEGYECPAVYHDKYECGSCRSCWDRNVSLVNYHLR